MKGELFKYVSGGIVLSFDRDVKLDVGAGDVKSGITLAFSVPSFPYVTVLINFLYEDISIYSGEGPPRYILLSISDEVQGIFLLDNGIEGTLTIPSNTRIMDLNGLPFAGGVISLVFPK